MAAEVILLGSMGALAGTTILTHLALLTHLRFSTYAVANLAVWLVVGASCFMEAKRALSRALRIDLATLCMLGTASVAGALSALVIHRPDVDDFYYVPNAVFYVEHPREPMTYVLRAFHSAGAPFEEIAIATSLPYEYLQAVVAHFTGLEYLSVYHVVFPVLVGFAIPMAWIVALSRFTSTSRTSAFGTLVMLAMVTLLGDTHRAFGNLSFARAFQGKGLFIAVGLPLFSALIFRFFEEATPLVWVAVSMTATALVGTTTTALAMLPALASVLAIAHLVVSEDRKRALVVSLKLLVALSYVFFYAVAIMGQLRSVHGLNIAENHGWPTSFAEHRDLLLKSEPAITRNMFVVATLLAVAVGKRRKLLLTWVLVTLAVYLNPLTAPFLIDHVTSPVAYWRLFYLLPFPLTIGIAASGLVDRVSALAGGSRKSMLFVCAAETIIVIALQCRFAAASIFRAPAVWITPRGYKLDPDDLASARAVMANVPGGAMLAPTEFAGTLTLMSGDYPQLVSRHEIIVILLTLRGDPAAAKRRVAAARFVSGDNDDFDAFAQLVALEPDIVSIVLRPHVEGRPLVRAFLESKGFAARFEAGHFVARFRSPGHG